LKCKGNPYREIYVAKKAQTKQKNAVVRYLRETRAELRKVHWPTRKEAWNLTRIVMVVTVAMALFLSLLDYLFAIELSRLISGDAIAIGVIVVLLVISAMVVVLLSRQRV